MPGKTVIVVGAASQSLAALAARFEQEAPDYELVAFDESDPSHWGRPDVLLTGPEAAALGTIMHMKMEERISEVVVNRQLLTYANEIRQLRDERRFYPMPDPRPAGGGKYRRGNGGGRKSAAGQYKGSKAAKRAGRKRK